MSSWVGAGAGWNICPFPSLSGPKTPSRNRVWKCGERRKSLLARSQGSLLHPAVVDVPSVQPVSALATRLRGRRSCGPEFGRTGG